MRTVTLPDIDPGVKVEIDDGKATRVFKALVVDIDLEDAVEEAIVAASEKVSDVVDAFNETALNTPLKDMEPGERKRVRRQYRIDRIAAELGPLDVVLKPDDGGRKALSEVLLDGYKAGKVTQAQITDLLGQFGANRPT